MLVDQYQPKDLNDLKCHPQLTKLLNRFGDVKDIPHLIFYGQSGAGKSTRVLCLLKALYGDSILRIHAEVLIPTDSKESFNILNSTYHTELFAADLGLRDRQCMEMVMKQISSQASAASFAAAKEVPKYRAFVIHEAHYLSIEAQATLRRTMEKFTRNTRVIMCCESLSKVSHHSRSKSRQIMAPLRSRCYCIRVPSPSQTEIQSVLNHICLKAKLKKFNDEILQKIAASSDGNIRVAIIMLQKASVTNSPPSNPELLKPDWKVLLEKKAALMITDPSPATLLNMRIDVMKMLAACIDSQSILEYLTRLLLKSAKLNSKTKINILDAAAIYVGDVFNFSIPPQSNAIASSGRTKDIIHIEAFSAAALLHISKQLH